MEKKGGEKVVGGVGELVEGWVGWWGGWVSWWGDGWVGGVGELVGGWVGWWGG